MPELTGSVGQGGANRSEDVQRVQQRLAVHGFDTGSTNGVCDARTILEIRAFQHSFTDSPDGRVDAGGATWRRLSADPGAVAAAAALAKLEAKPAAGSFNVGLTAVSNSTMLSLFGNPRADYTQDCQNVTNALLSRNIATEKVGPFNARGLKPALASLRAVFADVLTEQPAVHAALGTAGMLCARLQRDPNPTRAISNHSWGTAIDLTINGVLDTRGDNRVQHGLTLIAPIFNRHGWVWGALFPVEDSMHFEVGLELARQIKTKLT